MRPGVNIVQQQPLPSAGVPSATGNTFVGGRAATGPAGVGVGPIGSMAQWQSIFGTRQSYNTVVYDGIDAYFQEGGGPIWFCRYVGPAAVSDAHVFNDAGALPSIKVSTIGPGASGLLVAIVAGTGAGTFQIVVTNAAGTVVDQSYDLTTVADATTWATGAQTVTVISQGTNPPVPVAAVALTGGTDDATNITDTTRIASLTAAFPRSLGPGQMCSPNGTTDAIREGLNNLAVATDRVALLHYADTPTASTLVASALVVRNGVPDPSSSGSFANWLVIPGIVRGTTRVASPDIVAAALISRQDAATGNPNAPAAGVFGACRYAIGTTQHYTDADIQTLALAGINPFTNLGALSPTGAVELYGYRSIVDPNGPQAGFTALGAVRLRMALQSDASKIGQGFVFAQLDAQQSTVSHFAGAINGVLNGYWQKGAVYGATAADAYAVDVGPDINTPATLAANELNVGISFRPSPFAEMVTFYITPVPVTQPV